jgi:hypothetical protein
MAAGATSTFETRDFSSMRALSGIAPRALQLVGMFGAI